MRIKMLALAAACALSLTGCSGCVSPQAFDQGTVDNFTKVREWEKVERKKVEEAFAREGGPNAQDKAGLAVRHDALGTMLDTAIDAENAKKAVSK